MMNLVYDNIVYDLQRVGGISTYWYELSKRFLHAEGVNIRFVEFSEQHNNVQRNMLDIPASQITVDNAGGKFIQRYKRVRMDGATPGTIFHSSYFRVPVKKPGIKKVCTVHDFTHDLFFKGPRVWLHNLAKNKAVMESDVILTVSENTRRDLLNFYPGISSDRVITVYNGVAEDFHVLSEAERQAAEPFALYVGSRDTYKNFDFAVRLMAQVSGLQLYVVGSHPSPKETKFLDQQIAGRYRFFSNISTAALNKLYNTAYCLLYPSSYEGFGIPLTEAMQAGCPFIAQHASSIPEVAGDAGILLNGLDVEEGKVAFSRIEKERRAIISKGFEQCKQFSWDRCFNETYQIYKSI